MGAIYKNGIAYGGGGTAVEANPSASATDTLEKLKVGSTVYELAGGGSHIVQLPVVDETQTYTYNRTEQELIFSALDTNNTIVTGGTHTDAGTYTCTVALKGVDDVWVDMTNTAKTFTWTIAPKVVSIPTVTDKLKTYNTQEQAPTISAFDSNEVAVTGTSATTNAGSYTLTLSLTSTTNYIWSDNTTAPIDVAWEIAKATSSITLDKSSITLDSTKLSDTINVTNIVGDGTLSITSSDSSIVSVSGSGNTYTVTSVDEKSGNVTITFSLSATTNYTAATAAVTVTASFLQIVPFSTGTDAQIKAMLDAYYNDAITWSEMGWAIGDTRKISLASMQAPNPNSSNTWAAQDITVVIVAHDHTDLATPVNGHTKACITVQTRECMNNNASAYNQNGHIYVNGDSSYDTTFTKWSNLYMRTYMNDKVWGAFPSTLKDAIRPSKHYRHTNYNTSASEEVTDNLFLPSYPEIFGTASYDYYVATSPVEGTQFEYYQTSSNRVKYGNNNGTPNNTAQAWWQGSASSNYDSGYGYGWCSVWTGGTAVSSRGSRAIGLAPAFAM